FRGHHDIAADRANIVEDLPVAGGHIGGVDTVGQLRPLEAVTDHGHAANLFHRLTRETRRAHSGWNDNECSQLPYPNLNASGSIRTAMQAHRPYPGAIAGSPH